MARECNRIQKLFFPKWFDDDDDDANRGKKPEYQNGKPKVNMQYPKSTPHHIDVLMFPFSFERG